MKERASVWDRQPDHDGFHPGDPRRYAAMLEDEQPHLSQPNPRDFSFWVARMPATEARCEECKRKAPLYLMRVYEEEPAHVCFLCIRDVAERWGISEGAIQQCLDLLGQGRKEGAV